MLLCGSVHVEAAGRSVRPLGLLDIFLPGFYDDVQTAACAAWPQGAQPLCDRHSCCRRYRQSVSGCATWSIVTSSGGRFGCRCEACEAVECCGGRAVILTPVAMGAGCQAVIGQEQLLPGERGRVIQDSFQRATPGLRPR